MLLDRLVTDPVRRCSAASLRGCRGDLWGFCSALCGRRPSDTGHASDSADDGGGLSDEGDGGAEGGAAGASRMRTTQRVNLERLLPSLGALCWRFFRRLTVREPSFEEVVVVYAELGDDEHGAIPQLRLKSFRDIPVADVEASRNLFFFCLWQYATLPTF